MRKNNHKITAVDRKLIEVLSKNSRISYSELGRILGISRITARERINRLMNIGVIERFTIQIPAKMIGKLFPVYFNIEVEPSSLENAAKSLADREDIAVVYEMSGPNGLHVHGFFGSNEEISNFTKDFLYKLPGVKRVETNILLKRYKTEPMLLV